MLAVTSYGIIVWQMKIFKSLPTHNHYTIHRYPDTEEIVKTEMKRISDVKSPASFSIDSPWLVLFQPLISKKFSRGLLFLLSIDW